MLRKCSQAGKYVSDQQLETEMKGDTFNYSIIFL